MLLTKRIGNAPRMLPAGWDEDWKVKYRHVWIGATTGLQEELDRDLPKLAAVPTYVHWLSIEPMLGPIRFSDRQLEEVDWVIVGGESGHNARPMHPQWARDIRDQCASRDDMCRPWRLPFFFKQWGEWFPSDWILEPHLYPRAATTEVSSGDPSHPPAPMLRVGKKDAGELFDGRRIQEFPSGVQW